MSAFGLWGHNGELKTKSLLSWNLYSEEGNDITQTNQQGSQPGKALGIRLAAELLAPQKYPSLAKKYNNGAHEQPSTGALSLLMALGHPKEEKDIKITTRAEGKGLRNQLVLI